MGMSLVGDLGLSALIGTKTTRKCGAAMQTMQETADQASPPETAGLWLTIEEAARSIGVRVRGRPTHWRTVYQWVKHGLRGVRLRAVNRGGRLQTRPEWIEQFWEDYTAAIEGARETPAPPAPESATARQRRHERARKALERAGAG
jgi:hypothetical protein